MKNVCLNAIAMKQIKDERGVFMPVALLFFSVVFVICFYSVGKMTQEVKYHRYQIEWIKNSYLGDIGTDAAISMLDDGHLPETKGEWVYYNGRINYHIKPIDKGFYQITLVMDTNQKVSQETIIYSPVEDRVIKWDR